MFKSTIAVLVSNMLCTMSFHFFKLLKLSYKTILEQKTHNLLYRLVLCFGKFTENVSNTKERLECISYKDRLGELELFNLERRKLKGELKA